MKRLSKFAERHPILSMLAGWLLIVAVVLTFIPADPASVDQAVHRSAT